jgi:hypothetical protein
MFDAISITSASTNCVDERCTVCGFVPSASQESESGKDEDKQVSTLCHAVSRRMCVLRLVGECHRVLV